MPSLLLFGCGPACWIIRPGKRRSLGKIRIPLRAFRIVVFLAIDQRATRLNFGSLQGVILCLLSKFISGN